MISGRVGVEVGGTFTDLVWQREDGSIATHKVLSSPAAIEQAVIQAIDESGVKLAGLKHLVHGSTVATNALLTRSGTATGLITTRGFRDVLEIGTHDRSGNVYEIFYVKSPAPIPRRLIAECDERIGADGSVVQALDIQAAWAAAERLIADGVRSIAIAFLHAYANDVHERALADRIRARAPHIFVATSSEISPEFREFERTMTTAVNAFVGPVVKSYLDRLTDKLEERKFSGVLQIMQSSGGIMPAGMAGQEAVRMLLSGPAAGVRGAIWFARRCGIADAVTLDMGGTSTDVSLAHGLEPAQIQELRIDGLPIRSPAVDIVTVGAGGGSIASIDAGGFMRVGPESAGAMPGPACYGRGGDKPTVTDAQVVAGILRPQHFLGGRMALLPERASAVMQGLGMPVDQAADAVLRIVNSNMAAALRLVSTARGIDPREFVLVAFGGAGPVHGAMIAEEVGIERVLVPWSPGLISALGLLVADLTLDLVQTRISLVDDTTLGPDKIEQLLALGSTAAIARGLDANSVKLRIGLDLRYSGQAYEIPVWFDELPANGAAIRDAFSRAHQQRYGYARAKLGIEVVNYRVRAMQAVAGKLQLAGPVASGTPAIESGEILHAGARIKASYVNRASLPEGYTIDGPAVIEEPTSTTLVPPGWRCSVLKTGDLMLERSAT